MFKTSVVSYPDRGPWGRSSYRGNCTGHIIRDCAQTYMRDGGLLVDPSVGGGTSADVARDLGLRFFGTDLSQGFNLLTDDLARAAGEQASLVFWHPPYGPMIAYSGNMYGTEASPWDLSRMSLKDFSEAMVVCAMNIHDAVEAGGHYGILMGNYRKDGKYYNLSGMVERIAPGVLVDEIIKVQHNCVSDRRQYAHSFVRIAHEKLLIFRKQGHGAIHFLARVLKQIEGMAAMTWNAVVRRVVQGGGTMSLTDIYEAVEPYAKTRENAHWQAKVRQVLQNERYFIRVEKGVYKLSA